MNRFAVLPLAAALLIAAAPAVSARGEAYYTVVCDGVAYESVDARAVVLGHKDDAVLKFMENTPSHPTCRLAGPINP
jgi:hypothetical protein